MPKRSQEFIRSLNLLDATLLVAGSMVGSGIFIVSADMARQLGSPGLLLLVWLAAAAMTLMASLSVGELAAMIPQTGGQYVYLREAYGPVIGFLYGWTLFLVIQTGKIAAVAVAFAMFLGVLIPPIADRWLFHIGPVGITIEQVIAVMVIAFLTINNLQGLTVGKRLQNLSTIAKIAALIFIIVLGRYKHGIDPAWRQPHLWTPHLASGALTPMALMAAFGAAMVGALFASDGWNNVTFASGEVEDPRRNVPLALALGTGLVSGLYVLANQAYLKVMSLDSIQNAPHDRVAIAMVESILSHRGTAILVVAIMLSAFGCVNGLVIGGPRAYYAMARDGLFFPAVGKLSRSNVPATGMVLQGIWACVLTLTGAFNFLLDSVVFATLLFYVLTVGSIFVFRRRWPDIKRPYEVIGYPWTPLLYIGGALVLMLVLLIAKPLYTWPGLLIVLAGIPVYNKYLRDARPMVDKEEDDTPAVSVG